MAKSQNGSNDLKGLEADASKMINELNGLVGKIKELGAGSASDAKDAATEALTEQFKALQKKLGDLTEEHKDTIAKVDKSVRANPYLFILGALGLGFLLGKVMRS